tara:strand:+ start:18337 stop:24243 length:5907 start_codon:yes stop_codon:yes gene_type:complete
MKKSFIQLLAFFAFSFSSQAQSFNISSVGLTDTSTLCSGTLHDPGGPNGQYGNSQWGYFVINPPGNEQVEVTFTFMDFINSGDYIYFYDGVGTSGTYLGGYTGTNLPNGGLPITSNSDAITVYFTTNFSLFSNGFSLNWNTTATSIPNSNFTVSNNSPAFRQEISFTNTSTGSASSVWHFGDGTTSTKDNPTHKYSSSGSFQAFLISTNCLGSDTSLSQTINVSAAPTYSLNPDSIYSTVTCGNTLTASFDISHLGGGILYYDLEAKERGVDPYVMNEDFESGMGSFGLAPFPSSGFSASQQASSTTPDGSSALDLTGYTGGYNGLISPLTSSQPLEVSYYFYTTNTTYSSYIAIGNSPASTYSNMFYAYCRYGQMRVSTWFGTYYYTINNNQWNHVNLKNIDWTNHTFDLYLNGSLSQTGLSFADINIPSVNEIHLWNGSSATCSFDQIKIRVDEPAPVTMTPSSGVLSSSNTNTISLSTSTANMIAGRYIYDLELRTNGASSDSLFTIPWVIDVNGLAIANLDKTCFNFSNPYQGLSYQDSVRIINGGCDSLHITNIVTTNSDLLSNISQLSIQPWDTAYLKVNFSPSTIGTYTDSLKWTSNAGDTAICLNTQSFGAPQIETDSAVYNRYYTGCFDSVPFDFKIYNPGQSNLNWNIPNHSVAGNVDDFENGINNSIWSSLGSNIILNACDVNSGTQALGITGSNRYAVTNAFNLVAGDSVRFWARPGFNGGTACENPDGSETLFFDYSLNGSTWYSLGSVSSYTTVGMMYRYAVPVSGSISFRFRQINYTGSSIDNYIVDDFSVGNVSSGNFNPNSGVIAANDSVSVTGYFNVANLGSGIYPRTILIKSNDPVDSAYSITVNLNITGLPEIMAPGNCLTMDSTMLGFSKLDSIMIYNSGCDDLNITALNTATSEFSSLTSSLILAPDDTTYINIQFSPTGSVIGPRIDTLSILNNDSLIKVCLKSFALGAPLAVLDTNAINVTINSCDDSVLVRRTIYNNGQGKLNYKIKGNSSSNPGLQEVLDTFRNGHSTLVGHIPSPYYFFDGINGNNIGDGGGDMYDGGNYISTNLQSNIFYSQDLVQSSTAFGPNGQYFTYKGMGMWILAADLDGINNFRITGNLGADGSGSVNSSVLTYQKGSDSYKGFAKRVYNAFDPSINHLMIVKDDPAITRTHLTSTNNENHNLFGLNNSNRIYYILYAGTSGSFIGDGPTQNIMNNFIDMIHATGGLEDWLRVAPDSAQVAVADSVELDIWIKSTGLTVGNHTANIVVNTNDLANPSLTIPVNLTVNGQAEMLLDTVSCISFTNVLQGVTESDSLWIYNDGCDTLDISNISNSLPEFSVANSLPIALSPNDSLAIVVDFTPITVGSFADTLRIFSNDRDVAICLSGSSLGAPLLSLPGDSLVVEVNKCRIIHSEAYALSNIGQGAMNYNLKIGQYRGTNREYYNTTGASTDHVFKNTPIDADTIEIKVIINGDFGFSSQRPTLYINGNYYTTVYNNNLTSQNDTLIFTIFGANANFYSQLDSIKVGLINTTNVQGISGSFHQIDIRVVKNTNWVAITGSTGGTISPNGTANHNLLFNSAGLAVGNYRTILQIASNQPNEPFVHIPLVMKVISEEELVLSDTCVNFANTFIGDTAFERLVIYNIGCEPLNVSNIINTNNVFKLSTTSGSVAVDDSLVIDMKFVPTVPGNYSASLIINNSDTNRIVCVNGTAVAKPDAGFSYFEDNVCMGKFIFQDTSIYTPTGWQWDFGDGNLSNSPNPTHFFPEPGFYNVKLTVVNLNGLDTMTQVIESKALMAEFVMSHDTVYGDSIVNFGDSSKIGSSWAWDFGDGNTDTLKNPSHSYSQAGSYTVSLTVSNTHGCTETLSKTIIVLSNIGLDENQALEQMIQLYPNPSSGIFYLEIDPQAVTSMNEFEVQISDMTGRSILQISNLEDFKTKLDLEQFESGVYLLQVYKNGSLISHKRLVKGK